MDTDRRVLVDSARAVSCGWCGSYESDKWRHDAFRSSVWCSRSCYWAGHFGEFVCLTVAMILIDLFLVTVQLNSTLPLTPTFVYLILFLFLLTGFSVLGGLVGYLNRKKIPQG